MSQDLGPVPPPRIDAAAVASATGAVLGRTVGGAILGLVVGVAAFAIERGAGLLSATGWLGTALWALLPLYAVAGAAALGYVGALAGLRRATHRVLLDTGLLHRWVQRGLDRLAARHARPATDDVPAPPGWVGARVAAIGRTTADAVVARVASAAAPQAETAAQIDAVAGELIDEWGETATIVALVALAVALAAAPVALAVAA